MLVSTPNAVYGGVVADDAPTASALLGRAKTLARELGVRFLELRDWRSDQGTSGEADLLVKELYAHFDHPISTNTDAMMTSFPRDTRRMIRLGPKAGLTAETGRTELLDEFYEAYTYSVHTLGTPVFPKRLFRIFLEEFPDADILVIRKGRELASAVLSFYFGDTVAPYYAGAYPQFYKAGVNYMMYWELMRHGAARGCTRFDFGRSKQGTGAHAFKHNWGMAEKTLPYAYHLVSQKSLPDLTPKNRIFAPAIALWKKLPLSVSKAVGPLIVRHFP